MERMCSLYFPPFSLISTGLQEIQREKVQRVIVVPTRGRLKPGGLCWCKCWATTQSSSQTEKTADSPFQPSKHSPPISQTGTVDVPLVRRSLESQGISAEASRLIIQSWRSGTASQYQIYYKKWELFCCQRNINPLQATLQDGITFLAELFATGVGYSCINTDRSALLCSQDAFNLVVTLS